MKESNVTAGHAFVQNLRRGHYAISADLPVHDRVSVAFDELALSICSVKQLDRPSWPPTCSGRIMQQGPVTSKYYT